MALALQEQLNMEDAGGNAPTMAYQAGQPVALAPAAMIGRLTGTVPDIYSNNSPCVHQRRGRHIFTSLYLNHQASLT